MVTLILGIESKMTMMRTRALSSHPSRNMKAGLVPVTAATSVCGAQPRSKAICMKAAPAN